MDRKIHGVVSFSLILIALVGAIQVIIQSSVYLGLIYTVICVLSLLLMCYSYCSKCICRLESCGHIIPGKITKYLPRRKQERYLGSDYLGLIIPLSLIIIFPQYWLWKITAILIVFWSLLFIAVIDIKLYVCKGCKNQFCPMLKNYQE